MSKETIEGRQESIWLFFSLYIVAFCSIFNRGFIFPLRGLGLALGSALPKGGLLTSLVFLGKAGFFTYTFCSFFSIIYFSFGFFTYFRVDGS
jgi:hypothetical protein